MGDKPKRVYKGTCTVPGCERTLRARGLCPTHYARWKDKGTIDAEVPVGGYRWTQERAEAVAERVHAELLDPFRRVDAEIRFLCTDCGTEGVSSIHRMRTLTLACSPCSHARIGLKKRLSPERVREILATAQYELVGEYRGARVPVEVECLRCGTHAFVRVDNVRNGNACSECRFRWLSEHHRLEADEVARRAELARIELLEPFTSTHQAIRVRCLECGYESKRRISWLRPSLGCVRCGRRPYDFTAPAIVYLLRHREWPALKVGVTNVGSNRLATHVTAGWDCVCERPAVGQVAYEAEQAVLDWWREELKLPPYLSSAEVPQGGWTETVSADAVEIPDVIEMIDAAVKLFGDRPTPSLP